jgi:cell division protein FtsB
MRGQSWVILVGVLLAGIVFLNVSVLELNRGIASTDAKAGALERSNSSLRARVAALDSSERIQRLAEQRGYVLPQPGSVTYLRPHAKRDARLAATRITEPNDLASGTLAADTTTTTPSTATATTAPTSTGTTTTPQAPAEPAPAQPAPVVQSTPVSQPVTAAPGTTTQAP